jgi:molecular chaperone GrpE
MEQNQKTNANSAQNPKAQDGVDKDNAKIAELTDTLKRLQAEFENFQKRNTKQNDEFKQYATANLIAQLLPVLDTLEQGSLHNKELIFVYEQLYSTLKRNGLEKIKIDEHTEFDHDKMECLMQEKATKEKEGKVAHILISGYVLNGKVLRAAKVSVYSETAAECECKDCNHEHAHKNSECECGEECDCVDDCDCGDNCKCDEDKKSKKEFEHEKK